ncbi:general odorant-binding protein 56d-like [Anopheles ziemanni]|uniref:general odorant-binding protein 56d-like n=1 Tax=Anopheles coustani TaxID=139045 RepID=UPI002657CB5B|nr:general odorant-binding protein 56d-like [Anopheles coustani]XP_058170675.1 general odorant-binding protein 56d-like [Anopheles ziemanni]
MKQTTATFTVVVTFCLLAGVNAFTLRQQKMVSIFALECMAETGIDALSVSKLRDGDLTANDRTAKCFMKCFFEKESFIDAEGQLQLDAIAGALEKDYERAQIDEMLVKCGVQKEDPCETAFHAYECYHDYYQNQ